MPEYRYREIELTIVNHTHIRTLKMNPSTEPLALTHKFKSGYPSPDSTHSAMDHAYTLYNPNRFSAGG